MHGYTKTKFHVFKKFDRRGGNSFKRRNVKVVCVFTIIISLNKIVDKTKSPRCNPNGKIGLLKISILSLLA